ncbi:DUF1330 domain-containing protein [Kordiimonas sp. SCSIO 12603]|uniref:DUF1330 domain-containing protein n=1 Tax=Kordiimonas sp. SCSIO 12603 TaxID=2829596 RepID=UPI002103AA50|nr:DUF1330 domain-containing protein [Kordiimonas sp. SCSIO 12603]UTW59575.1 DUF1330 domain-containing protein [Kordiimonas sp. SCSIO 12603]
MKNLLLAQIAIFLIAGIWHQNSSPVYAGNKAPALHLEKGQYLTVVLPETNPAKNMLREAYYSAAFPLAEKYGLKREAGLKVEQKIISDYSPSAALFFSYPDQASERKLTNEAMWPEIVKLRKEAWKEIKFYSATIEQDLNITFDPEKSYTLVVAWTNPEHPNDYFRYLDAIKQVVNEAGGRFIYKMQTPKYEANTKGEAPAQLTFVEWDTPDAFAQLSRNPDYKKHVPLRESGIQKLEFYRLTTPQ